MISTSVFSFREVDKKGIWLERAVEYPQLCQSGECQGARGWNVDSEGTVRFHRLFVILFSSWHAL